ncbi:5-(carboxyamino)imidazole ribonucleotide synthase [Alkalicaulis satelles]|uniref:N5-carboxyaminoimidazole ribonucleotide synthase n=1 Tax=Alkalicaulis satelles TaxID=2609175 RepID=A0A5M6ZFW0_9PROT|nr:5-(carboxyamino)imidazole ribonucleotide synthase [Alkalicaulis satelles]KAA5803642.1 5-(carboxyamino)imidazole ribonucleotide synthase [Alkalicaulis satelles]
MSALKPADRIGILGGGQLGRMLALAAARLGLDAVIFDPEPDCPASRVAVEHHCAPYEDLDAVARFAASVQAVTFEFENVPVESAREAARHAPLRPGAQALETAQDRLTEKTFLNAHGARTVEFRAVDSADDARAALSELGAPAILKTRRLGYDGKGQAVVKTADEAADAFTRFEGRPAILEAFAPFRRELSILAARSLEGDVRPWPLADNRHQGGILRESLAPADVSAATARTAEDMARAILEALDYVGVMAVELFELEDGTLRVNEIAPRVHNTGHWTMDAARTCQFEQHVRAVAGWPLGDPSALRAARMINLIGSEADDWARWLAEPGAHLHLYGKRQTREGRKMGHVTLTAPLLQD